MPKLITMKILIADELETNIPSVLQMQKKDILLFIDNIVSCFLCNFEMLNC